ncbi:MAG: LysR family transcriptional regulator [Collinsella sp.]
MLLETVRAGSFTRAAERLSYSQSGVSRMVADLEADWGFKVLDRSREGVVFLPTGGRLCRRSRRYARSLPPAATRG